jgi:DNA repair protein RadD
MGRQDLGALRGPDRRRQRLTPGTQPGRVARRSAAGHTVSVPPDQGRQAVAKLSDAGVSCGIIAAGVKSKPDHLVQVASIQTIVRRLNKLPAFDLIVFDEAHHAVAGQWEKLINSQPKTKLLGVTATPARLDGKGRLGTKDGGPFDDMILGPDTTELIEQGFLAPAKCYVPAQRVDLSQVRVSESESDATHATVGAEG